MNEPRFGTYCRKSIAKIHNDQQNVCLIFTAISKDEKRALAVEHFEHQLVTHSRLACALETHYFDSFSGL